MIRREFGTWCLNSSTEAAKRRPRVMPVVAGRLAPWLELWLAPQQRCVRPAGVSAGASNRQKARYIGSQNMSAGLRIRLAQQEPAERTTRGPPRQQNMPTAARARQPCAAVEPPRSLASPVSPHPPDRHPRWLSSRGPSQMQPRATARLQPHQPRHPERGSPVLQPAHPHRPG
jgi:hypothetical protein